MTREEAIKSFEIENGVKKHIASLNKNHPSYQSYLETIERNDMAISALSEELSEDGTLTVHVKDGSKVNRVFVMGENIFGGLYYPDSAEIKGDLISRQSVLDELEKWDWQELYLPIHFKQILDDVPSVENKGEDSKVADVLDKISAEIDEKISHYEHFSSSNTANGLMIAKEIIEKYKGDKE